MIKKGYLLANVESDVHSKNWDVVFRMMFDELDETSLDLNH